VVAVVEVITYHISLAVLVLLDKVMQVVMRHLIQLSKQAVEVVVLALLVVIQVVQLQVRVALVCHQALQEVL
jgi:hypothetical protein